jgi:hypothetical protein
MLEVIRTILTNFKQGVYNIFTGSGRPDEEIRATSYQHYGFVSVPPAGTEFITLQYGQNSISVAESAGSLVTFKNMQTGDLCIYTQNGASINIHNNPATGTEDIYIESADGNKTIALGSKDITLNVKDSATDYEQIFMGNYSDTETRCIKVISTVNGKSKGIYINQDGTGRVDINNNITGYPNFIVWGDAPLTPVFPTIVPGQPQSLANQAFVTAVCTALSIPILPAYVTQATSGL